MHSVTETHRQGRGKSVRDLTHQVAYTAGMDTITDRAQALLQERLGSIRDLEKYAQEASSARDALRAAESKLADAWTAATKAGWTVDELRKLGIEQPGSRRGGRPRTAASRRGSATKKRDASTKKRDASTEREPAQAATDPAAGDAESSAQ